MLRTILYSTIHALPCTSSTSVRVSPLLSVLHTRRWHNDAAGKGHKIPEPPTRQHPVMFARDLANARPTVGESFFEPVLKPERPIVPRRKPQPPAKSTGLKATGVHLAPKVEFRWDWRDIDQQTGGVYTHKPLRVKTLGGRHPYSGRKMNQRVRRGVAFDYFIVDIHRVGPADGYYEERVLEVRRDPNRTAHIAQCAGERGRRWLIATVNMKAGDIIRTTSNIPERPIVGREGDAHPVGALAVGTVISSVECILGVGAQYATYGGGMMTIVRHADDHTVLVAPHKAEFSVRRECMCTVGQASGTEWKSLTWASAYIHLRLGVRQKSGLWHRKDGYCGRKAQPIPKLRTLNDKPLPLPKPYRVTLTKKDTCAVVGIGAPRPVMADGH